MATAPATADLVTAEELARLPNDRRHRYELVRGTVITMAPPGFEHGYTSSGINIALGMFARDHGGQVVVEAGFLLTRDPDTVRAPDIAFVSEERLPPPEERVGYFPGAPDLAIEVVSPGDTATEVLEKVREYVTAGTRLVWVVDPQKLRAVIYRSDGTVQFLSEDDALQGEDVLPGFALPLREIFQ